MFVLSTFLVFYLERQYFDKYKELKDFNFTMDFLIALATHITYVASIIFSIITIVRKSIFNLDMEFWEVGYSLSFFIGIGHYLEDKIKTKTSLGIKDLLKLQSRKALVFDEIKNDFVSISSSEIKENQIVRVLKGSTVPTDGILIDNLAQFDCSSIFGESIPRDIKKNQTIFSGMINVSEAISYKVTKKASDSMLNNIINQLENILKNKSTIERTSEKIVKWFLPTIILISIITFCIWLGLSYTGIKLDFFDSRFNNVDFDNPFVVAIYHSVATLVIACPCAFGIAAPAAIYSSSGLAARNKILFSSAKIYESIKKVKYIAFDKTGTLTNGKLSIVGQLGSKKYNELVYQLSSNSTHPLSKAISEHLRNDFNKSKNVIKGIKEIQGKGMEARDKNNNLLFLGSIKYLEDKRAKINIDFNEYQNESIVAFSINNELITLFLLKDEIKSDSLETINKFKRLNIEPIIISGDRKEVVESVANQLGIEQFYYEQSPLDKQRIIEEHEDIIFVGDGINDVLAIKTALVGIAYSTGSDITNSIADISIYETNLNLVYKAIILARRTLKLVRLNFIWASLFNFICIPLAIIGIVPPWLGALLMVCSTLVLLISTLVSRKRNKRILER